MSLFADRLVTIPFAAIVSVTKYSLVGVPNPVRNCVPLIVTVGAVAEASTPVTVSGTATSAGSHSHTLSEKTA